VTVASSNMSDGIWFETWRKLSRNGVVDMIVYIHVSKEKRTKLEPYGKKSTFVGYIESHMEIDSEEQKAPKDDHIYPSSLVFHPLDYQEELVETIEPVGLPRDVAVTRKRLAWIHDTL